MLMNLKWLKVLGLLRINRCCFLLRPDWSGSGLMVGGSHVA